MMKKGLLISLLVLMVLLIDCDCTCLSRDYGTLKVKVTIDEENPEVYLVVLEGDIETGDTIIFDTLTAPVVKYDDMLPDTYYSAAVVYARGSRNITAVDGKYMVVKEDEECDCYWAETITLNLQIE